MKVMVIGAGIAPRRGGLSPAWSRMSSNTNLN